MKKQTLTMKMIDFMEKLDIEIKVKKASNLRITSAYYNSLGITENTTMNEWINGVSTHKYPEYESITRAIRKARELNPQWQKPKKQVKNEIDLVEKEVGYKENPTNWFKSLFD